MNSKNQKTPEELETELDALATEFDELMAELDSAAESEQDFFDDFFDEE